MLLRNINKLFLFLLVLLINKDGIYLRYTSYFNNYYGYNVISEKEEGLYLKIPSIKLDEYVDFKNALKDGIVVNNNSIMPDYDKSMLIILGHSGMGKNVFFNHLKNVRLNDLVIIDYNNKEYTYIIDEINTVEKGNNYTFKKNENRVYLITCIGLSKQLILVGKKA